MVHPQKAPGAKHYEEELRLLWVKEYLDDNGSPKPINVLRGMKLYQVSVDS